MSNTQQDNRVLMLGEQVYQSTVKGLIQQIINYNIFDDEQEKKQVDFKRRPITLIINSYGGSAYDGWGLIGAIEMSVTPIVTIVIGSAMSMALAIFVSGHQRLMHKYSTLMYHEVATGTEGSLTEIKQTVDEMQRLQDMYDNYMIERTKLVEEKLIAVRDKKDNWFIDADTAMKFGIAEAIITDAVTWIAD